MKVRITQIRSAIGRQENQKRVLRALGIRKMHQTVVHEDSPTIMGMVNKIKHLLKVEEDS
ncbi:MAG: 50S ribosomal protein L30 [candidate division Zixibacteria bacterium]|nr:50S ribosomal protein L30 [candidate division Zixibacteria bacterium]